MQQSLVLSAVGLGTLWVGWSFSWSSMASAAGILVLLMGHALVLAVEFMAVAWINRNDSVPRAGPRLLLKAWWQEVHVAPAVFAWRQPFRWRRCPDNTLPLKDASSQRAAVFVHGFVCNRGLWLPWLAALRSQHLPYTTVNLEPAFGSINDYIPLVEDAVRRAEDVSGLPPIVVCHSMGGLAVRAWLAADPANANRVHRVVTIGSPHHGTWLGRFSLSANGQQMRLHGPWVTALAKREKELLANPYDKFVCWYSNADNIVFPASTALLPGADNRHVPGAAHVALTFHPEVMNSSLAMLSSGASSFEERTDS
jgi:triacylglycerol lipase